MVKHDRGDVNRGQTANSRSWVVLSRYVRIKRRCVEHAAQSDLSRAKTDRLQQRRWYPTLDVDPLLAVPFG
jgi:hypothetical protein